MTMPPEQVDVWCPQCGEHYQTWRRASFNLSIETFDDEYIHRMTHATCPKCKTEVALGAMIVRNVNSGGR